MAAFDRLAPSRLRDDRGMPTGQLVAARDEPNDVDLPRLTDVEQLPAGRVLHRGSEMVYWRAGSSDHTVAVAVIDGVDVPLRLPRSGPATLEQWQDHRAKTQAAQDAADEKQRARWRTNRRPVTLADVTGEPLPTVKAAFDYLIDHEALIDVIDGELRIALDPNAAAAPGLVAYGTAQLRNAVKVVYAAQALIVDCLHNGVDVPDCDVDPNGRVIP